MTCDIHVPVDRYCNLTMRLSDVLKSRTNANINVNFPWSVIKQIFPSLCFGARIWDLRDTILWGHSQSGHVASSYNTRPSFLSTAWFIFHIFRNGQCMTVWINEVFFGFRTTFCV